MWRPATKSLCVKIKNLDETVTIPDKSLIKTSKNQLLDVQELLVMHKRLEENAFRRVIGRGLLDLEPCCRSVKSGNNSGKKFSSIGANVSRNFNKASQTAEQDKLRKTKYSSGKGYLDQLMTKEKISHQHGNEHTAGLLDLRKSSNDISKSTSLRLPKFTSLPPENKEIFYTRLSCISALSRLPEIKMQTRQTTTRKVTRKTQIKYGQSNELGESCLHVRALLGNDNELSAITAVGSANTEKNERTMSFPSVKEIFATEKADKKQGARQTNLLYLFPTENHTKLERFRLSSGARGTVPVTMRNITQRAPQQTERAVMVENGAGNLLAKINDENNKLKDKRNVHFSEFLHEVHLYSPYTASEKSV